jgi:hypothetical protein
MEYKGPLTCEKFVFLLFKNDGEVIEFNHWSEISNYKEQLKISKQSIQFFLRNSCIFPPYTIYLNVLMLPTGSPVEIDVENDIYKWANNFRFLDEHSTHNQAFLQLKS